MQRGGIGSLEMTDMDTRKLWDVLLEAFLYTGIVLFYAELVVLVPTALLVPNSGVPTRLLGVELIVGGALLFLSLFQTSSVRGGWREVLLLILTGILGFLLPFIALYVIIELALKNIVLASVVVMVSLLFSNFVFSD